MHSWTEQATDSVERARILIRQTPPDELRDHIIGLAGLMKATIFNPEFVPAVDEGEQRMTLQEVTALFDKAVAACEFFIPVFSVGQAVIELSNEKRPWWQKLLGIGKYDEPAVRRLHNNLEGFRDVLNQVRSTEFLGKTYLIPGDVVAAAKDWIRSYELGMEFIYGKTPYR